MALISLALPCYAADYTTGEENGTATNVAFENVSVDHTGWVWHYLLVTTALTVDEDTTLDHAYIESVDCTMNDETITAYCVKFKQSYDTIVTTNGCTITDLGGVEYEVDCGVLSDGRYTNPKCNRCEGDE